MSDREDYSEIELAAMLLDQERQLNQAKSDRNKKDEKEANAKLAEAKMRIKFSQALADEICERIASGELLIKICEDWHIPPHREVRRWIRDKNMQDFALQLKEAEQDRLAVFEEQIISIADDAANDYYEKETRNGVVSLPDNEVIARSKLRVEMRLKHLKAGNAAKWSDNASVVINNAASNIVDGTKLSDEELKAEIDAIRNKQKQALGEVPDRLN